MKKLTYLFVFSIIFLLAASSVQAQQMERIIALTGSYTAQPSFTTNDSISYIYIGQRHVDTTDALDYSDSTYEYKTDATGVMVPFNFRHRIYTTSGRVLADTAYIWDTAMHSYRISSYEMQTYDGNDNLVSQFNQTWDIATRTWVNLTQRTYTRNAAGLVTNSIGTTWTNNAWDTTYVFAETYDSQNRITYLFNRTLNFGTDYFGYRYFYTYDPLNRGDTILEDFQGNDTTIWQHQSLFIDSYDVSGYIIQSLSKSWQGSSWYDNALSTYTYDSHHNQTGLLTQFADAGHWTNYQRNQATFDSYDMITSRVSYHWDSVGSAWYLGTSDRCYHYYYERYTPDTIPSGIADIAAAGDARIYPVPAAAMLSLDLRWTEAQVATATIYDLSGRKQSQWTLPNTTTYHGYIPVSQLAEGVYTLSIKGASGGSISRTFSIVK